MVYSRAHYFGSKEAKSHTDLIDIWTELFGPGDRTVAGLFRAAYRAKEPKSNKRGPHCTYAFVEVILSSDRRQGCIPGPNVKPILSRDEALRISRKFINRIWAVSGMIGVHTHPDGRVDIHILIVNEAFSGNGLESGLVNPATKRPFRSLKVVGRAVLKIIVDEINVERRQKGDELLITMYQAVARKIARREKARAKARDYVEKIDREEGEELELKQLGGLKTVVTDKPYSFPLFGDAADEAANEVERSVRETGVGPAAPTATGTAPSQDQSLGVTPWPSPDHVPNREDETGDTFSDNENDSTTQSSELGKQAPLPPMDPGPQVDLPGTPPPKKLKKQEETPAKEPAERFNWEELEWLFAAILGGTPLDPRRVEAAKRKWLGEDGKLKIELSERLEEACESNDREAIDAARAADVYYHHLVTPIADIPPPTKGPETEA